MSIKVMSAVWENAPVSAGTLLVLLALADHANEAGVCWPSVPTLAEKARLGVRQTRDILKQLEEGGLIRRDKGTGPHGANTYKIVIPKRGAKSAGVQNLHVQPTAGGGAVGCRLTVREPSLPTGTGTRPPIFALYENHIGTIDRYMADRLIEAEQEYSEECLEHSFAEASEHNVHNWKYVVAILQRHKREGCYVEGPGPKKDRRGDGKKGSRAATANAGPDLEPWKRYAAGAD